MREVQKLRSHGDATLRFYNDVGEPVPVPSGTYEAFSVSVWPHLAYWVLRLVNERDVLMLRKLGTTANGPKINDFDPSIVYLAIRPMAFDVQDNTMLDVQGNIILNDLPLAEVVTMPRKNSGVSKFPHKYPVFLSAVLRVLADAREHGVEEIHRRVAAEFALTIQDLEFKHDSTNQSVFQNKVACVFRDLVHHKCIVAAEMKQSYRITDRGLDVFKAHPYDAQIADL